MNSKPLDAIILRYVGFGLLFLGLAVMLYLVRGALPVFVLGGVIAYALEPLLQRMEKRGSTRGRAVGYVFVIYVLLGIGLLTLFAAGFQQGQALLANAGDYNRQFTTVVKNNRQRLNDSKLPAAVKESLNEAIDSNLARLSQRVGEVAPNVATATLAGTGTFLINGFLLTLISFGFMLEAQRIRGRLLMLVPPLLRRDVTELSHSINELLGRYVRGQLIVCGTFGALCTVLFEILNRKYDMQYPLVLGAVAATFYILPYFGPGLILLSAGLTAYFTSNDPVTCAIAAVGGVVFINLCVDYGIAPRVLGRGVGLHPLMVVFALLCGFQLGGPLGTVVAVPIFASLRVIAIYLFPQLAAPLPDESPAARAENTPHNLVTQATQDVAQAENAV